MNKSDIQRVRDAFTLLTPKIIPSGTPIPEALAILDAALARDEKPVAYYMKTGHGIHINAHLTDEQIALTMDGTPNTRRMWSPLYLHPPVDAKDAARFRWSRDTQKLWTPEEYVAIVDAAIKGEQKP